MIILKISNVERTSVFRSIDILFLICQSLNIVDSDTHHKVGNGVPYLMVLSTCIATRMVSKSASIYVISFFDQVPTTTCQVSSRYTSASNSTDATSPSRRMKNATLICSGSRRRS
jgi:hypothetical protein